MTKKSLCAGLLAVALAHGQAHAQAPASPSPPGSIGRGVLQSWSRVINDPSRFEVLTAFNGQAVLDHETQLVWERTPYTVTTGFTQSQASNYCATLILADRAGWRLPTVQELTSLLDVSTLGPSGTGVSGTGLPNGNPFAVPTGSAFWSSTPFNNDRTLYYDVVFAENVIGNLTRTRSLSVWCVRGGIGSGMPAAQ
ncbi:MAG: DUF1566 domain-containing protein [Acetobacteraceae bacterium]|nr:DUF1566 domain-containing protein [Acetobacteraceae bacterium]